MARNDLTIRSVIKGLRPSWLLELRPCRSRIARQSFFSGPRGDLVFELQPSSLMQVNGWIGRQARIQFRSLQTIAIEFQDRLMSGLQRCIGSSLMRFQRTPKNSPAKLAASGIATQSHRPHLGFWSPTFGDHEPIPQIAACPLSDRRDLVRRAGNSSARKLPNQGSQINQNHMRRLLQTDFSPIERQQRMNQNEENNVNQRVADRRESDCDRRR